MIRMGSAQLVPQIMNTKVEIANLRDVLNEAGFYEEGGFCTSHKDGSKDTGSANINKIQHALIILILALLI